MVGDARVERSVVVPVYGNEDGIPDLLAALRYLDEHVAGLEAVLVVDGSPDQSFDLLRESLPAQPFASQLLAHSRNFGAFPAVRTGLQVARGRTVAVMAADLQEPPELIVEFFQRLDEGDTDVVVGVRASRDHDGLLTRLTSRAYWRLYRRFVVADVPEGGVDVFACKDVVRDALLDLSETNSSLVAQLFWVGFRRDEVRYDRRAREHGQSAWSTRRRLRYMADSIFAFSDLPILLLLWAGIIGLCVSTGVAAVTLVARLLGAINAPGFATIVLLVSFLFSLLITTQGIIGMYLWRAFENTKGKPTAIVMWSKSFEPGLEAQP